MKTPFILVSFLLIAAAVSAQNYDESKVPSYTLPDALTSLENKKITTAAEWENLRRKEVLYLFSKNVYGQMPKQYDSINFALLNADYTAMNGKAHMKHVKIEVWRKGEMAHFNLLLFLPAKISKAVPCMVFINNGRMDKLDPSRKEKSDMWPAEMLIDSGFAIAGFHANEVSPDNNEHFREGVLELYPEQLEAADGMRTIGAWSWAAGRVMDYLATESQVDPKHIGVVGYSRGGKAALWAAAQDQRFTHVFSNCSGNTGAALSRRMYGETVAAINTRFPYWFTDNYKKYNDKVNELPVDQHLLISLIAPRPVYATSATEDLWADPRGTFLALKHAEKVYALYDRKSALGEQMPAPETPVLQSTLGYHLRTGKHDLTLYDWKQFVSFMNQPLR
jgi:hypothetical protein